MNEGLSAKLKGLSLKIVVFKFVNNSFKDNKVIATYSKNQKKN
jgi:hypothetical protein